MCVPNLVLCLAGLAVSRFVKDNSAGFVLKETFVLRRNGFVIAQGMAVTLFIIICAFKIILQILAKTASFSVYPFLNQILPFTGFWGFGASQPALCTIRPMIL